MLRMSSHFASLCW